MGSLFFSKKSAILAPFFEMELILNVSQEAKKTLAQRCVYGHQADQTAITVVQQELVGTLRFDFLLK